MFPPQLSIGSRVWSDNGFLDHGPAEGPKVSITSNQGGTVTETQKPYHTYDFLLYTVQWDNGQTSKHYSKDLLCIGKFQSRSEFEAAIRPTGSVALAVGPAGGFRSARFELEYDGQRQTVNVLDQRLWKLIEPIVDQLGVGIATSKLPSSARQSSDPTKRR